MDRKAPDVADAELSVLGVLWEQGPATIRRIADALYPAGTVAHYATVQKLLERLEAKGYVGRDRADRAHVFRATVGREEIIARRLRETADKLCGGSLIPLVTNLVRAGTLSDREREELRALMAELERKAPPDGGRDA
jgi:BlaI family transcriptional regulator, penicillinase repressor